MSENLEEAPQSMSSLKGGMVGNVPFACPKCFSRKVPQNQTVESMPGNIRCTRCTVEESASSGHKAQFSLKGTSDKRTEMSDPNRFSNPRLRELLLKLQEQDQHAVFTFMLDLQKIYSFLILSILLILMTESWLRVKVKIVY